MNSLFMPLIKSQTGGYPDEQEQVGVAPQDASLEMHFLPLSGFYCIV